MGGFRRGGTRKGRDVEKILNDCSPNSFVLSNINSAN